jgi:hypothetical protein
MHISERPNRSLYQPWYVRGVVTAPYPDAFRLSSQRRGSRASMERAGLTKAAGHRPGVALICVAFAAGGLLLALLTFAMPVRTCRELISMCSPHVPDQRLETHMQATI